MVNHGACASAGVAPELLQPQLPAGCMTETPCRSMRETVAAQECMNCYSELRFHTYNCIAPRPVVHTNDGPSMPKRRGHRFDDSNFALPLLSLLCSSEIHAS